MSPPSDPIARPSLFDSIKQIGPGIAIAATGVGAADLVTSAVAGSKYGMALVWAIGIGALLKFVLNEGVARWHLATGTSILQGWARHLGRPVLAIFLAYLLIWSFFVAGGLIVASGLAAASVFPGLSRQVWGIAQAILALLLVWFGSYRWFEKIMKMMIAVMFVTIVGCAVTMGWRLESMPGEIGFPLGAMPLTLGLAGGVGGSVTMLVYGYWIEERQWKTCGSLRLVRVDLAIAYAVTGLLAVAAMFLAGQVLLPQGITIEHKGQEGLVLLAGILADSLGFMGQWIFLVGFWGAAFSSLLGVMQGVPYLFADLMGSWRSTGKSPLDYAATSGSRPYRIYLCFLALAPTALLYLERPLWIVVVYAAVSSLFLPFLTVALLVMNNRNDWIGADYRNRWPANLSLVLALAFFAPWHCARLANNTL